MNLDHWDLFEIWFVVLGIYVIIVKQIPITKSANYFFNDLAVVTKMLPVDIKSYFCNPLVFQNPILPTINRSIGRSAMIGKVVSHYIILEKLGQGGTGVVYKALYEKFNRISALKFFHDQPFTNEEQP